MLNTNFLTKIEAKNLNIRKELEEVIHGFGGFEILRSDNDRRPDLLIFELGNDLQKDFQIIQSLMNMRTVGEVFLISENLDHAVLLQAMRMGVKEFISQPLDDVEVIQALDRFKKRTEGFAEKGPVKIGHIIDVLGSKGGIGSTTIAVNLAVSLAEKKNVRAVALMDMNMLYGEVPLFLEVTPKHHWGELIKNISRLDPSLLMNILSQHSSGVYVLSSPGSFFDIEDPDTPDLLERLLGLMKSMFDFVVIDAGSSLEKVSLKMVELADEVLLVSILSLPCLATTNKILKSFDALGYPPRERLKVVINHYTKDTEFSLKDAEKSISKAIFWTIPSDPKVTLSAINQGKPLSHVAPKAQITKNLTGLADVLTEGEDHLEKGLLGFLKRSPMP